MLGSDTSAGPVSLPVAEDSASAEENGVEEEEGNALDDEDEEGLAYEDVDDVEPLAAAGEAVLYVSAEESVEQVSQPFSIAWKSLLSCRCCQASEPRLQSKVRTSTLQYVVLF